MAFTRFNIKGVPFRFRGAINVEECSTAEEVIKKAGLDWEVAKCPLVADMPFGTAIQQGESPVEEDGFIRGDRYFRNCPNAFATYRTDINVPLGIVKEKYTEVQNKDAFAFFNNAIGQDKAIWQTAGFFGNGERIFVSAKLPYNITVNGDPVDNYLVFTTSHDGSSGVKILFTPIRVVCENTLNAAIRGASNYVSFRHTKSVHTNIDSAAELLGICKEQSWALQQEFEALSRIKVQDEEAEQIFANLILSPDELIKIKDTNHTISQIIMKSWSALSDTEISTRKANMLSDIYNYYFEGVGQREILGTGWGVYNAVTGYYSNVDNIDGAKRMDSLLYGSRANKIKDIGDDILLNWDNRGPNPTRFMARN